MVRIRTATAADGPAIATLYRSLSPASALLRFNSALPSPAVDAVAALGPDVHAVLAEDAGRVVGEARWCGDAHEIGITVADDYQRLGLGPVLLDRLRAAARAAGIGVLTAMVRTDNPCMIRLLEHVGSAVTEPVRDMEVTFEIGTDELMPGWPDGGDRPRVLVESHSLFDSQAVATLREQGADVRKCLLGKPGTRECPLLSLGRCRLAEGADVVACLLGDDEVGEALVAAHQAAGRPVATSGAELRRSVTGPSAG